MYCKVCGTENNDGVRFCAKCGTQLLEQSQIEYQSENLFQVQEKPEKAKNKGLIIAIVAIVCVIAIGIAGYLAFSFAGSGKKAEGGSGKKSKVEDVKDPLLKQTIEYGEKLDSGLSATKEELKRFVESSEVADCLNDTNDENARALLLKQVKSEANNLKYCDALYVADWDADIQAHSMENAGGKIRNGKELATLQESMLNADGGIFNEGIQWSTALNKYVYMIFCPVYDGNTPIGFVGCALDFEKYADEYVDISDVGYQTIKTYIVDKDVVMLWNNHSGTIGESATANSTIGEICESVREGKHKEITSFTNKKEVVYRATSYVSDDESFILIFMVTEKELSESEN